MTLLDLCKLARRYWKMVVFIPIGLAVACALIQYLVLFSAVNNYTATVNVFVNSQYSTVSGLISYEIDVKKAEYPDFAIKSESLGSGLGTKIKVSGQDEESVADCASTIADYAVEMSTTLFKGTESSEYLVPFVIEASEVSVARDNYSDIIKYPLVAFLVGVFIAVCLLVIIDVVRRPIKNVMDVQAEYEIAYIGSLPDSDRGRRLFANFRFASSCFGNESRQWCLIPLGKIDDARTVANALEMGADLDGVPLKVVQSEESDSLTDLLSIVYCNNLKEDINGVYAARKCDQVFIVIHAWKDSLKGLAFAIHELSMANVRITGFVFIDGDKNKNGNTA